MKITPLVFILVLSCFIFPVISIFVNILINFAVLINRKNIEVSSILAGLIGSCLILVFQTYNILYFHDFIGIKLIGLIILISNVNMIYCLYKMNLDILLIAFILCVLFAFYRSIDYPIKTVSFIGNVIIPYTLLYIQLISKPRSVIDHVKVGKMIILIVDLVVFSMIIYTIADLVSSFEMYRFSSINLAATRGEEIAYLTNGIPVNFQTSILGMEFMRYMGFIADPLRSAYFGIFLILFGLQGKTGVLRSLVYMIVGLVFVVTVLSKGAILTLFCVITFWFLLNYKLYAAFIASTILLFSCTLFLAADTSTSGWIHLSGLIGPFTFLSGPEFLYGDKLYLAGNMGRILGEPWTESVLRGAESLIGTYMYSFGIIGVSISIMMHIKMIIVNILDQNNAIASFVTSSLIIIFLQEGHYNSSQAFLFSISLIFLKFNSAKSPKCAV